MKGRMREREREEGITALTARSWLSFICLSFVKTKMTRNSLEITQTRHISQYSLAVSTLSERVRVGEKKKKKKDKRVN